MVADRKKFLDLHIKILLPTVQQKKVKNSCVKRVKCRTSRISHDIFEEQRTVIKIFVKSGKTGVEIMPLLNNMYGKVTMKKSAVHDWIQRFQDGQEYVNDDLGHGRHTETRTPFNIERVRQLLDSDRCLSIKDVTDKLLINCETVRLIVKDELVPWKLCPNLFQRILSLEHTMLVIMLVLYQMVTQEQLAIFAHVSKN